MHLGQHESAGQHAQLGLALAREVGEPTAIALSLLVLGCLALAEGAYAEAQGLMQVSATTYHDDGRHAESSEPLADLGYVARRLGDPRQGKRYLCQALEIAVDTGALYPLMYAIPVEALLAADEGDVERAVELYVLASRHPVVAHSRWFEEIAGKDIAAAAAGLPPDVVAAAQERGLARELWATAKELLAELKREPSRDPERPASQAGSD
jgi:hypothetical protein